MRYAISWALVLFCLALGACAPSASVRPDQLSFAPLEFEFPEVQKVQLPNGIRLYLRQNHELPLVQVTAMVGAGSISDPADQTGRGDLFAVGLRTGGAGSLTPEELDEKLEQMAADVSVATDTYTTTVGLSLRSIDLRPGLDILSLLLRAPEFDSGRLDLARLQAIEVVRRQDDEPGSVASRAMQAALYGDHPLGRTPSVKTLNNISRDDLVAFHRATFHPDNLWIGISGDFDRQALLDDLEVVFGDWSGTAGEAQAIPEVGAPAKPALWVADKDLPQTTILFGELGIDKDNPDLQALRVMNYILGGGGFNSRLMREVRSNRGLAYSVYSYYQVGRLLPGPFLAGCETKSDSTAEVARLMKTLMEEMRHEPVSAKELKLAKDSLVNSFVFAFDDTHKVVTRKMRLDFYNYPEGYLETYRDRVAAVTIDDVTRVAQKYLNPERQNLVLVGSKKAFAAEFGSLGLPVREISLEENGAQ